MGHQISAIITRDNVDLSKAKEFDLCIIETVQNVKIIPLDPYHSDYWTEKLELDITDDSDIILDCETTRYFSKQIGIKKYVLIETDYHGGIGDQLATVYENNNRIMSCKNNGINEALSLIGIVKTGNLDEFDSIQLGKYRNFSNLFEKYYES